MSEWRRLVDVLKEDEEMRRRCAEELEEDPEKFETGTEMYRKFVEYTPINGVESITLSQRFTGWREEQTAIAEDLQWHPVLIDDKPYLISKATEFELFLQGERGAWNRLQCLTKYVSLYTDTEWDTEVRSLNEEMYKKLPQFVKSEIGNCWLDDSYATETIIGAKSTWYTTVHETYLQYTSTKPEGEEETHDNYYGFGICIVIHLPEDILVNVDDSVWDGSCGEKALKISKEKYEVEHGKQPETQEDVLRKKIGKKLEGMHSKQLKDLYQYITMFMKENPKEA